MEVRYPPPQKGYLSDTCAIPYENKANACDTPLCDTISKGYCAIWGGISHWAAKLSLRKNGLTSLFKEVRVFNHFSSCNADVKESTKQPKRTWRRR